ncbi:MAG: DUF1080 domain-containing protein [Planctomycetota bacterium]|nr:DUF1080 domain-containing protein [Planctomycetota bacterium]
MHRIPTLWLTLSHLFILADPHIQATFAQSSPAIASRLTVQDEDGFVPLLNGQDLSGWVTVNTAPSTWKFEEGMLICSGKPIGEIRTERMYQNFVMEIEWRHMVPRGNAGIFVWADDITARGQPFHRGIEVQVLENDYGNTRGYTTHGDIFPIHGAKMTPINGRGGSRAFPIENRSNPSPEWNHYRITCLDGNIALEVNGKLVTQGRDCWPKKGYICLESEGGVVHYRNARIKELPETKLAPGDVAIANRGYQCQYSGVDFSGWTLPNDAEQTWHSRDWVFTYTGETPSEIRLNRTLEDFGFILDVKFGAESAPLHLDMRGKSGESITLDPGNPQLKKAMKGNGWHRLEGTLVGEKLNLSVDGTSLHTDLRLPSLPPSGHWIIRPTGPTEFSNPYIRSTVSGQRP